jgi:Protein of unknown function (DUF2934)
MVVPQSPEAAAVHLWSGCRRNLPGEQMLERGQVRAFGMWLAAHGMEVRAPKEINVIRRAYELWQKAGEPSGKDDESTIRQKRSCNGGSTTKNSPPRNNASPESYIYSPAWPHAPIGVSHVDVFPAASHTYRTSLSEGRTCSPNASIKLSCRRPT